MNKHKALKTEPGIISYVGVRHHWDFFFFFFLFMAIPSAYGISSLGVESELQLLACTIATATQDPSHICGLHSNSCQYRIFNPLSEARHGTHILMDPSRVHYC